MPTARRPTTYTTTCLASGSSARGRGTRNGRTRDESQKSKVESREPESRSRISDCGSRIDGASSSAFCPPARSPQPPSLRVPSPQSLRRALTLIELLVVIIILTTVVAAAIPILAPAGSDRELREATRGLNTYITGARRGPRLTRRPFGIALKRLSADTGTTSPGPTRQRRVPGSVLRRAAAAVRRVRCQLAGLRGHRSAAE